MHFQLLSIILFARQIHRHRKKLRHCRLGRSRVRSFTQLISAGKTDVNLVDVDENETAIILYTSGTTGRPKGAMLTHKNIYSNARDVADYLGFSEDDRVVATLPVFHVFAFTVVVNAPFLRGATILLVPRFSPGEILELLKKKATIFAGVPTMLNFCISFQNARQYDLRLFRLSISGGSSLPVAVLHDFEDKFDVRISEGYGLSESSPVLLSIQ